MFEFLKKKGDSPPDVGQEEEYDSEKGSEEKGDSQQEDMPEQPKELEKAEQPKSQDSAKGGAPSAPQNPQASPQINTENFANKFEVEKLGTRVESLVDWIKQFYDRFAYVSENIGSIRNMAMANEKAISKASLDSQKAIDIVKEVEPDKLRIDYQKLDVKIQKANEKVEMYKQLVDNVMNEFKEIQKKSEVFIGTEGILKLNDEVKGDLVDVKKLAEKTKMHADKSEQLFMELRNNFAEYQKVLGTMDSLDANYSGLKEELDKLKVAHGNIVSSEDFNSFVKSSNQKFAAFESKLSEIENVKKGIENVEGLVEDALSIAKRNREDIGDLGLNVGNENVKKVSDYENQLADVTDVLGSMTEQIALIKKKLGLNLKKIEAPNKKKGGKKAGEGKEAGVKKPGEKVSTEKKVESKTQEGVGSKSLEDKNVGVEQKNSEKVENKTPEKKVESKTQEEVVPPKKGVEKKLVSKKISSSKKVDGKKSSVKKSAGKKKSGKKSSKKSKK